MAVRVYDDQTILIKGENVPCIVDKEYIIIIYQGYRLKLLKETGQVVHKLKITSEIKWFETSHEICHIPTYYINNGRKCHGCEWLGFCLCRLNKLQFKKVEEPKVETDTPTDNVSDSVCDGEQ